MISVRFTSAFAAFGVLCGLACHAMRAAAQDPPNRDNSAFEEVSRARDLRGIPAGDLPKIKAKFPAFAKYYADFVAYPPIYKAPNDPKFGAGFNRPKTLDDDPASGIFTEMRKYLFYPTTLTNRIGPEKADYIREMGIAFDAVLKPMIDKRYKEDSVLIRINAMRMLAEVCRSGAAAHWPTVTAYIKSADTPPELKNYAFQAAAHLLAAYDVTDYKSRKHSPEPVLPGATVPQPVADLVAALIDCVQKPQSILRDFKANDPDQAAVLSFIRRNAVRALAKVRFVTVAGADKKTIYPAYALAQVCVSDPALGPPPSPAECIEAVLGLCNMAPSNFGTPVKDFNVEAVVEAMVAGLRTFAKARAEPSDHSLPWRHYSLILAEALEGWKPLFDPIFEATSPRYDAGSVPGIVNDLIGRIKNAVIEPINKVDAKGNPDPNPPAVKIEDLERYLDQLRENPNRKPLVFGSNPATVLKK